MKETARPVPASTRSCGTALSRSATRARRFQTLPENADKMRTKCIQNRKFDFSSHSESTTYNFNALKCPHFHPSLNLNPDLNLDLDRTVFSSRRSTLDSRHLPPVSAPRRLFVNPASLAMENQLSTLYKTRQNGTNSNFLKTRSRRTNNLRRHLAPSSHFAMRLSILVADELRPDESGSGAATIPKPGLSKKRTMTHFERKKGWGERHFIGIGSGKMRRNGTKFDSRKIEPLRHKLSKWFLPCACVAHARKILRR
jgi:hypothetical protein